MESGFRTEAEIPGGLVSLYLARLTTIDPPFAAAMDVGARFVDLTQSRDLPSVELELLRRAYVHVMG